MKKTPLKRKTPLRRKSTATKRKSKLKNKGYKIPSWFMAIKPGSHGNTPTQKRVWRVVSETYRKEDFEICQFCPCCGHKFETWEEGQLGHWLRYSLCKGWMKYERTNLALICAGCNMKDDAITLKKLGEHLQMLYGEDVLDFIDITNRKAKPVKMDEWQLVSYVARLRPDLVVDDDSVY